LAGANFEPRIPLHCIQATAKKGRHAA